MSFCSFLALELIWAFNFSGSLTNGEEFSVGEIRYKSCDVGIVGVKNYLITPFIPFQMKDEAEILYYDITLVVTPS